MATESGTNWQDHSPRLHSQRLDSLKQFSTEPGAQTLISILKTIPPLQDLGKEPWVPVASYTNSDGPKCQTETFSRPTTYPEIQISVHHFQDQPSRPFAIDLNLIGERPGSSNNLRDFSLCRIALSFDPKGQLQGGFMELGGIFEFDRLGASGISLLIGEGLTNPDLALAQSKRNRGHKYGDFAGVQKINLTTALQLFRPENFAAMLTDRDALRAGQALYMNAILWHYSAATRYQPYQD